MFDNKICCFAKQVKIALAAVGTIKKDLDETHLQEIVSDIVVGALRGINIHLNLSQYQSCPRLWREHMSHSAFNHMQYDQMVKIKFNVSCYFIF